MTIYEEIIDYCERLGIAFVPRFFPYYISSAFCHLFNLMNYDREVLLEHSRPWDTRLHVCMVAPPGFMKSLILETFLMYPTSIFGNSIIETAFEASTTGAGFVGTIKMGEGGQPMPIYGLAHEHRHGIVGIEEFSALTSMMKTDHSADLDNALLTALDKGWIHKRLAAGPLSYRTSLTLLAATQPKRFDITSGLGRRLVFIYFIPNPEEREIIKEARRQAKGVTPVWGSLNAIKARVAEVRDDLYKLKYVAFSDEVYRALDSLHVPHYEEALYERLALGYNIAQEMYDGDELIVGMDNNLEQMFKDAKGWRDSIVSGADVNQILAVLVEPMTYDNVLKEMYVFGLSRQQAVENINLLLRSNAIIKYEEDEVVYLARRNNI